MQFGPCAPDNTTEAQKTQGIRGIQIPRLSVERTFSLGAVFLLMP